jgi:hypothetical protein
VLITGDDMGEIFDGYGFEGVDSLDRAATNPPRLLSPPKPRPAGFGLLARVLGVDCGVSVGPFRPALSVAACSSALVGSLIGDFGLLKIGDDEVD